MDTLKGTWAHVRRKFFDVHAATASPIAEAPAALVEETAARLFAQTRTGGGVPLYAGALDPDDPSGPEQSGEAGPGSGLWPARGQAPPSVGGIPEKGPR